MHFPFDKLCMFMRGQSGLPVNYFTFSELESITDYDGTYTPALYLDSPNLFTHDELIS